MLAAGDIAGLLIKDLDGFCGFERVEPNACMADGREVYIDENGNILEPKEPSRWDLFLCVAETSSPLLFAMLSTGSVIRNVLRLGAAARGFRNGWMIN